MESGLRTYALSKREKVDRVALAVGADPAVARLIAGLDELSPRALRLAAAWQKLENEKHQVAVEELVRVLREAERDQPEREKEI